ncbi:hypothetical protein FORC065_3255 [Yersinia enterocolitica]|nr:hypothetical protein FORC065_3255 [Yersinia enterocolitica]
MLIPHMTTAVAALKIILLAQGVSTGELKKALTLKWQRL